MTAELAMTLPALTVILALMLLAATAGVTQLRVEEAARAGARQAARGESLASATATAQRLAGAGASVDVSSGTDWVRVRVTARVEGPFGAIIDWPLIAEAVTYRESALPPVMSGAALRTVVGAAALDSAESAANFSAARAGPPRAAGGQTSSLGHR